MLGYIVLIEMLLSFGRGFGHESISFQLNSRLKTVSCGIGYRLSSRLIEVFYGNY